jgi:hypothetical protein
MTRLAPHLPDTGILAAPDLADVVGGVGESLTGFGIELMAALREQPGRLEQVAVEVELQLLERAVADPDRRRAAVAGEWQRLLGGAGTAVQPVEHLQPRP